MDSLSFSFFIAVAFFTTLRLIFVNSSRYMEHLGFIFNILFILLLIFSVQTIFFREDLLLITVACLFEDCKVAIHLEVYGFCQDFGMAASPTMIICRVLLLAKITLYGSMHAYCSLQTLILAKKQFLFIYKVIPLENENNLILLCHC